MKRGFCVASAALAMVACGDVQVVKVTEPAPDPCLTCLAPETPCRIVSCSANAATAPGGDACGEALAEDGATCAFGAGVCNEEGECVVPEADRVCTFFWEEPSPCISAGDCHPSTTCSRAMCEEGQCAYAYAPTGLACAPDSYCITGGCCTAQRY